MTTTASNDILQELAHAGDELPRDAMRRALDTWQESAPPLLALLEAYADGRDRSEAATGAVFFVLHLVGQAREQRALPAICRLAGDAEALEDALGDGISSTLPGILIGTFDRDLNGLQALIEDEDVDEIVRADAFDALTYLTATGVVPREATAAYLRDLHSEMQPQEMSFAWYGWQKAIALLGLEDLKPLVASAFERGFIDPTVTDYNLFLEDLRSAQTSEDVLALFEDQHIAPLDDAIAQLSKWHTFSEEHKREKAGRAVRGSTSELWDAPQPLMNPLRAVGRNDPCPCGSGKKFKKCCLH
ncbi:DUF1186 domain-containing protein [Roseicella aerolata]|uniref:DUF1186 domain-containing protein n=1 Tax=Roseicella aerolata TaxID=2883479 RepID=UPI00237D07D8|nr:DUF1186 domain-containing protein [Roseicella aerolata]